MNETHLNSLQLMHEPSVPRQHLLAFMHSAADSAQVLKQKPIVHIAATQSRVPIIEPSILSDILIIPRNTYTVGTVALFPKHSITHVMVLKHRPFVIGYQIDFHVN